MAVDLVLQSVDENGNLDACHWFDNLPIDRSSHVCVISPGSALRNQLLGCLRAAVLAQGGRQGLRCQVRPGGRTTSGCLAGRPGGEQLVVAVVNGANPSTPELEATVQSWLAQPGARGLGILPSTEQVGILPPSIPRFQIARYTKDVCEAVDDVLTAAGADLDERKIFLSYAHEDSDDALQLAEALADQRFQVFLDTRAIPAASVWEDVLRDAIVDAGLVVVLETAASSGSAWVKREIGLAQARGAGVLAVQSPDSQLGEEFQFSTPAARFKGSPSEAGPFVVEQHRLRLSSQRAARIASVKRALRAKQPVVNGPCVHTHQSCVGVYERPVGVGELRRTVEAARTTRMGAATFSPLPVLSAKRRDRLWMHDESDHALSFSDGMLTSLGQLP